MRSVHYGEFKTCTCRAPPIWKLQMAACLHALHSIPGLCRQCCTTRRVVPVRKGTSAASTEASKAHGCGHVWIQTVFILIILLGFSLHATQVCYKTRKLGAVSIQFADNEQHSQCRELSDCHRRLQWPGSQSRTLHEAFHPPCGFALPLARSVK